MKKKLVWWILLILCLATAVVYYYSNKKTYLYSIDSYKMDLVIHEDNTGDYKREIKYTIQSDIKTERIYDYLIRLPEDLSVKMNGKKISLDSFHSSGNDDQSKVTSTSLVKTLKKGDKLEVSYSGTTSKILYAGDFRQYRGFAKQNLSSFHGNWYISGRVVDLLDYPLGEDGDKIPPITSSDITIETDKTPEFQLLFAYNINYDNLFRVFEYASAKEKDGKLYLHADSTKYLQLEIYFNRDIINFEETEDGENASFEDAQKIQNDIVDDGINAMLWARILPAFLIVLAILLFWTRRSILRHLKELQVYVQTFYHFLSIVDTEDLVRLSEYGIAPKLGRDDLVKNAFLPYHEFIGRKTLDVVLKKSGYFLYLKHPRKISSEVKPLIDILPWKKRRLKMNNIFLVEETQEQALRQELENLFSKYLSETVTVKGIKRFYINHRKTNCYHLLMLLIFSLFFFIFILYTRQYEFITDNFEQINQIYILVFIYVSIVFVLYLYQMVQFATEYARFDNIKREQAYQIFLDQGIQHDYYRLVFYQTIILGYYSNTNWKYVLQHNLKDLAKHTTSNED